MSNLWQFSSSRFVIEYACAFYSFTYFLRDNITLDCEEVRILKLLLIGKNSPEDYRKCSSLLLFVPFPQLQQDLINSNKLHSICKIFLTKLFVKLMCYQISFIWRVALFIVGQANQNLFLRSKIIAFVF